MTENLTEEMTDTNDRRHGRIMPDKNMEQMADKIGNGSPAAIRGGAFSVAVFPYGSPAAIRGGLFPMAVFVISMAPQLQSATAHFQWPSSPLLWLPSCNPRRPILGGRLRHFYSARAAIRDGPFSVAVFATSMAPQLQSATAHSRWPSSLLL